MAACALACTASIGIAQTPFSVSVSADAGRVPVWQGVRVVVPENASSSPAEAAALAEGPEAIVVDSPNRILGRGIKPFWGLFWLQNQSGSDLNRMLTLEATTQYDVQLFVRSDSGSWVTVRSIAEVNRLELGSGTMTPAWEVILQPGAPTAFLLRLSGPSLVRFPVYVSSPAAYAATESRLHSAVGAAIASCLLVFAYILWLRKHLNDQSVPLVLVMVVADLLGALWLSGYLAELLPGWTESARSAIGLGAYATLFGCGLLHARIHLECARWMPRGDRLLRLIGIAWIGTAPWLQLAAPAGARVLVLWGGTAVALLLVVIALRAHAKAVALPGFIAAAWIIYLLTGISFALPRLIDSPNLWLPNVVALLMSALVAVIFGYALGMRLRLRRFLLTKAHEHAVTQEATTAALMRERSLYFAATSHDLRQPLLGVALYADLLKSATSAEDRQQHARKLSTALGEIDGFLVGMQQLVAESQSFTKPPFDRLDLDTLLVPIVEEYRLLAVPKQVSIRYVSTRLAILTNAHYFRRIVRNALSNAVHYTEPGGRILVGCRRDSPARLVIIDTGRGMTDEQVRLAFNSFQRFDATMLNPDGFGLGLFSTHSLADSLGLTVTLHSKLGQGTEFRIRLPDSSTTTP